MPVTGDLSEQFDIGKVLIIGLVTQFNGLLVTVDPNSRICSLSYFA